MITLAGAGGGNYGTSGDGATLHILAYSRGVQLYLCVCVLYFLCYTCVYEGVRSRGGLRRNCLGWLVPGGVLLCLNNWETREADDDIYWLGLGHGVILLGGMGGIECNNVLMSLFAQIEKELRHEARRDPTTFL